MSQRVPLVSDDAAAADARIAAVYARFRQEGREPINLYRSMANAPAILRAYNELAVAMRHESGSPRALRELAILRTAKLLGSEYEWAHHVPMARAAGVSDAQIDAVADWSAAEVFEERERAVLRCADEVHECAVSTEAFAELERHVGPQGAVEVLVTAAFYQAIARVLDGLGVELEPRYRSRR